MKEKYLIEGMSCTACSSSIERILRKIDGVTTANVNLIAKMLYIEYDDTKLSSDIIISKIEKAGFGASKYNESSNKKTIKEIKEYKLNGKFPSVKTRLIVSFSLLIPLMYVSMGHMINLPLPSFMSMNNSPLIFSLTELILSTPILIVNRKFFVNGYKGIVHKTFNMDTLISLGSLTSYLFGIVEIILISIGLKTNNQELVNKYVSNLYFDSSAMILSLITIGKAFEEKAKYKTISAIESLKSLAPSKVNIMVDGIEKEENIENLKVGDLVIIKAGEFIPVDGIIEKGYSYIDDSSITGESIPKFKNTGDEVLSASINTDGYIIVKALKVGNDTTLSKIINSLRDAGLTKPKIQLLADKISSIFVPVVMILSLITFILWISITKDFEESLFHTVQVLVISCPCALGLATPVAVTVSIGSSAKSGILIKDASVFEELNKTDVVIFDKTGTLTEGNLVVDNIVPFNITLTELIDITKSIEIYSNHPISKAILNINDKYEKIEFDHFENIPGKGIKATKDNECYIVGNKELIIESKIDLDKKEDVISSFEKTGESIIYVGKEKELIGLFIIKDKVKDTSFEGIKLLKEKNIYTALLSGDSFKISNEVKDELKIDIAYDSVLPMDKERIVREVRDTNKRVVFVGDGINDSPALESANVGIAVGNAKDIAIESADVILLKNDIREVNNLIDLSHRTVKIIKENLLWAFIYNLVCIPIAAGALSFIGFNLTPMIASLFMSISSLVVVSNALRLNRRKRK